MSVTVKDIADRANVSTATVSRALNPEQTGIKPEVRTMIVELAEKMGYQKKGRKKASATSGYVGIIYKREPTSFINGGVLGDRLYQAIELSLFNKGKQVLMHNLALDESAPAFIEDGLVSGVLLVELDIANEHRLLKELKDLKIPAVAVNHPGNLRDFDVVSVDYIQCFEAMTKTLIDSGSNRPCFLSNDFGHYVTRNAFLGYSLALLESGMSSEDAIWMKEADSNEIGHVSAHQIVEDGSIDAVVCMSNLIAANLIAELKHLGKSIPGDIRVCGFDPELGDGNEITSGIYNLSGMTQKAVEQLEYRIENIGSRPVKVLTGCEIQAGKTV